MFKLFGKSKSTPPRVIDMGTLLRLAGHVEGIADEGGSVSAEKMEELASKLGIPTEDLYAGLATSPVSELALEHELQFLVCTGGCQARGALSCIESLLTIRAKRLGAGKSAFDVVPRQCLTRCANAPVIEIRSQDGGAVLTEATPKSVTSAVKDLLDG